MDPQVRGAAFHVLLRRAIQARGLSLESLQRRLNQHGVRVGRSTLSFWQNGRRIPTGPDSLRAVQVLESVLDLPTDTLVESLGASDRDASAPGVPSPLDALVEQVGCTAAFDDYETLVGLTSIDIDADGVMVACEHQFVVRALRRLDRIAAYFGAENGSDIQAITPIATPGLRVGRMARDPEHLMVVAELILDRPVPRGELTLVRQGWQDANRIPATDFCRRVAGRCLMTVIDLHFDPQRMPVQIEEYEKVDLVGPDVSRVARTVDPSGRISLIRERPTRGAFGARWEYADPD